MVRVRLRAIVRRGRPSQQGSGDAGTVASPDRCGWKPGGWPWRRCFRTQCRGTCPRPAWRRELTERNATCCCSSTRVRTVASLVELATAPGCASPWSSSPSPIADSAPAPRPRPPRRIGRCRSQRSSCAAGAGPRPPPAALGQRLGGMLGLVAPHDHGEERRLLLPTARHRHPEHGPCNAALGVAHLGLVGEVAGEADGCLGYDSASWIAWPGGPPVPRGTGDGGHRGMPTVRLRGKRQSDELLNHPNRRPWVGSGSRVGWWSACGCWGWVASTVRPDPSTWAWRENEAPTTRAACSSVRPPHGVRVRCAIVPLDGPRRRGCVAMAGYDVVVVGGGSAGGGCMLEPRPGPVGCLVEAGPDYGPYAEGCWPEDLLNAHDIAVVSHDWGIESGSPSWRARVLAGRSAHNGCFIVWGPPADSRRIGPGRQSWMVARGPGSLPASLRANHPRPTITHRGPGAAPAGRAGGGGGAWPAVAGRTSTTPRPSRARRRSRSTPKPWNAAFAYLDPARARPNLTIMADTLVDRLHLEGSRAKGVLVRVGGRVVEVAADLVVVAAGAYGSPAVLLRSGLGPAGAGRRIHRGPGRASWCRAQPCRPPETGHAVATQCEPACGDRCPLRRGPGPGPVGDQGAKPAVPRSTAPIFTSCWGSSSRTPTNSLHLGGAAA